MATRQVYRIRSGSTNPVGHLVVPEKPNSRVTHREEDQDSDKGGNGFHIGISAFDSKYDLVNAEALYIALQGESSYTAFGELPGEQEWTHTTTRGFQDNPTIGWRRRYPLSSRRLQPL